MTLESSSIYIACRNILEFYRNLLFTFAFHNSLMKMQEKKCMEADTNLHLCMHGLSSS